MTLDQLLRCALPAVVASFYACGSEGPAPALGGAVSQPCRSDTDCKGERVCVDGYCKSPASSGEGPCGNSPLTGKYLWEVADCQMGSEVPFTSSCRGQLSSVHHENDEERKRIYEVTYDSLQINFEDSSSPVRFLELHRSFTENDLSQEEGPCQEANNRFNKYQCLLSKNLGLYVAEDKNGICLTGNLFLIRDAPWTGRGSCREQVSFVSDAYRECSL